MTPADPEGDPGDARGGDHPHESNSPYLRRSQTGYLQSRQLKS